MGPRETQPTCGPQRVYQRKCRQSTARKTVRGRAARRRVFVGVFIQGDSPEWPQHALCIGFLHRPLHHNDVTRCRHLPRPPHRERDTLSLPGGKEFLSVAQVDQGKRCSSGRTWPTMPLTRTGPVIPLMCSMRASTPSTAVAWPLAGMRGVWGRAPTQAQHDHSDDGGNETCH